MSTERLPTDMTVQEYLDQTECWLDDRTWQLVPIDSLSDRRRIYAARALLRNSTAFISLIENERNRDRDLAGVMQLINRNPKDWMTATPLYGAIFRDEREPVTSGIMGPGAQITFNPPRST